MPDSGNSHANEDMLIQSYRLQEQGAAEQASKKMALRAERTRSGGETKARGTFKD
jgi:hypothetical protein